MCFFEELEVFLLALEELRGGGRAVEHVREAGVGFLEVPDGALLPVLGGGERLELGHAFFFEELEAAGELLDFERDEFFLLLDLLELVGFLLDPGLPGGQLFDGHLDFLLLAHRADCRQGAVQ